MAGTKIKKKIPVLIEPTNQIPVKIIQWNESCVYWRGAEQWSCFSRTY